MAWKTVSDKEKFEFAEKDDFVEGKLIACRKTRFDCNVYDLQDNDGANLYFFGCSMLDTILPELVGKKIKITYLGKVDLDAGRTMRDYNVDVWEDDAAFPGEQQQDEGPNFP